MSTRVSRHWMMLRLGSQLFGLPAECVQELVRLGVTPKPPGAPAFVRGLATVRGRSLLALDLRRLLQLGSAVEECAELSATFARRKQDHIDWLTDLRASVTEGRRFARTTDPHQCAFGKWYDTFTPDDPVLSLKLLHFDAPHRAIHAIGAKAVQLVAAGRPDAALAYIDGHADSLAAMVKLFDEALPLLGHCREVLVVATFNGHSVGLVADEVLELAQLSPQPLATSSAARSPLVSNAALAGDRTVFLLDCQQLLARSTVA